MPPGNESTKFPEQHVLEIHNISKTNTQLQNKHKYYFSDAVETCVPWAVNKTQQIDLAFNIFFMVYFFIRVTHNNPDLHLQHYICFLVHCCLWQVLVHAGTLLVCGLLHHPTFFCIYLFGQVSFISSVLMKSVELHFEVLRRFCNGLEGNLFFQQLKVC